MAKTIEEQYLLETIRIKQQKENDYREVENPLYQKYEGERQILEQIYMLIEDGYKYRKMKEVEKDE